MHRRMIMQINHVYSRRLTSYLLQKEGAKLITEVGIRHGRLDLLKSEPVAVPIATNNNIRFLILHPQKLTSELPQTSFLLSSNLNTAQFLKSNLLRKVQLIINFQALKTSFQIRHPVEDESFSLVKSPFLCIIWKMSLWIAACT